MAAVELVAASPERATLPIGSAAPTFEGLPSANSEPVGLSSLADREAIVLIFSSNRCPTAKAYAERMNELQRQYGPRGVQVVAVNANDPHLYPDEAFRGMVARAAEDGYAFPYIVDEGQLLARAFGATCTFHVFLLDQDRRLRYQGRFDDSRIPERVTSHDLHDAIDDVLAGRAVRVDSTRAFGCSLDLV